MRVDAPADIIELLNKARHVKSSSELKTGDFVLAAIADGIMDNYVSFGRLKTYAPNALENIAELGKGYNINIIVPPQVEVLQTHGASLARKYIIYKLNEDELTKIAGFLKCIELTHLNDCLKV